MSALRDRLMSQAAELIGRSMDGHFDKYAETMAEAAELIDELLPALDRAKGELVYMAEKMPHTNVREALAVARTAIAKAKVRV